MTRNHYLKMLKIGLPHRNGKGTVKKLQRVTTTRYRIAGSLLNSQTAPTTKTSTLMVSLPGAPQRTGRDPALPPGYWLARAGLGNPSPEVKIPFCRIP